MIEVITQTTYNKVNNQSDKTESDSESDTETEIKTPNKFNEDNKYKDEIKQKIKGRNVTEIYYDIKWLTGC